MNKNLLNEGYKKIDEEIKRVGFIDDSDNTDRFLDNLANQINEDEQETILEDLKIYVNDKYDCLCEVDEIGNAEVYFYSKDLDFNSIEEFNKHFDLGE